MNIKIYLCEKQISQEKQVKYLVLVIDRHLSWKTLIHELIKKVPRGIALLSKVRHYVNKATFS